MGFRIDVDGVARTRMQLQRTADMTVDRITQGMVYEAERIMADSKTNFVPVRTGTLRSSGFVRPPRVENGQIIVEFGFGGAASLYAIIVHERPAVHADRWSKTAAGTPGQRKYLETPARHAAPQIPARLAAWVDFLKAGGR